MTNIFSKGIICLKAITELKALPDFSKELSDLKRDRDNEKIWDSANPKFETDKEKPQIVMNKVKELFPDISPESVVLMDDNDDTLGMYMAQTPFCTAHPMIFMEYL